MSSLFIESRLPNLDSRIPQDFREAVRKGLESALKRAQVRGPGFEARPHPGHVDVFVMRSEFADYQRLLYRDRDAVKTIADRSETGDIVTDIHNRQKALLFNMAVDSLNPLYRQVYDMFYVEDVEIKQIAARLDKTYKAIDSILFRIRNILKKEMRSMAKDFFEDDAE